MASQYFPGARGKLGIQRSGSAMGTVSQSPVVVIGCAGRQAAGTWTAERSERQRKPRAGQNLESVIWYQGGADSNISTKRVSFFGLQDLPAFLSGKDSCP